MNHRLLLFVFFVGFMSVASAAQENSADDMAEDIGKAIRNGSAREMARYFGQNVDLYLPRAEGTFSRSQSEIILREFFSRNSPRSYTVVTQGASGDGSVFVIGRFTTRQGQTFRSYILIKKVSQTYYLHHVQFDQI